MLKGTGILAYKKRKYVCPFQPVFHTKNEFKEFLVTTKLATAYLVFIALVILSS